jgi:hypothetical protein
VDAEIAVDVVYAPVHVTSGPSVAGGFRDYVYLSHQTPGVASPTARLRLIASTVLQAAAPRTK